MKLVIDISEHDYDWIRRWAKDGTQVPVYDTLARYIAEGKVLSEEQGRKTGKWIIENRYSGIAYCSECGMRKDIINLTCYCEDCGAKMELR